MQGCSQAVSFVTMYPFSVSINIFQPCQSQTSVNDNSKRIGTYPYSGQKRLIIHPRVANPFAVALSRNYRCA